MSGCITICIPIIDGTPRIPSEYHSLDVTSASEKETINIDRFYSPNFKVVPELEIYYSKNEMIIQFARDCAAKQNLQFVYTFENGKWLFISSNRFILKFIH